MRIPVLAAVAVIALGVVTGCERTVPGTVAMTTEPGASTTTRPSTTTSRPSRTTSPTGTSPTSAVPAPANAMTMTCGDYTELDDATQEAVIRAILADKRSMFPKGNEEIAKTMADAMCQFLPNSTVSELLVGGPP